MLTKSDQPSSYLTYPSSYLTYILHIPILVGMIWSMVNIALILYNRINHECSALLYYQISDSALYGFSMLFFILYLRKWITKDSYFIVQFILTFSLCMFGLIGLLLIPYGYMCKEQNEKEQSLLTNLSFLYIFQLSWPLLYLSVVCVGRFLYCCAKSC